MGCFITWQLEPENSGLFGRKPIINSLLNKTNEPKKKNEERKLAEQETKFESKTEEELHAYAWKSTHMRATRGPRGPHWFDLIEGLVRKVLINPLSSLGTITHSSGLLLDPMPLSDCCES
ncbi:hypothetical protein PIB30_040451 [Stylosanthes scabra]|uniref:Uncharacterized protein n=1 Tax=Stylosanthes scabra TaxID=79078 RepID=A0ABU6VCV7_9FABA|nr:hypothetical protein [Stylosanthes scabra]